jgi:hypothetical protein
MREFSAEGEVIAMRRAMRLVRARRAGGDEYEAAQTELTLEIDELDENARGAAVADLIHALTRVASVASILAATHSQVLSDSEILDYLESSLMESSIEHNPDEYDTL